MLEARYALSFVNGMTREAFGQERIRQYAVLYAITVFGEAAGRVSEETCLASPDIPWRRIKGMRNRIVHDYTGVDLDVVWDTVNIQLPRIITALEKLVPMEID